MRKVQPNCPECGGSVVRTGSGVVCEECNAKLRLESHVREQSLLPLDWSDVPVVKSRARVKFNGRQPETLAEQNTRLARHGERQRPLFSEVF